MTSDTRDLNEMISAALASDDDDVYWGVVGDLQREGSQQVFDAMLECMASAIAEERCLGADVLGQLGFSNGRPFVEQSLPLLLAAASSEHDPEVIDSVVSALGHQHDPRTIPGIVRHLDHPSDKVRFSVAAALNAVGPMTTSQVSSEVVPVLSQLMADRDADVRDWATFALANLEIDGADIRERLMTAALDSDECVRGEATLGLARRHDCRVVPLLRQAVEAAPTVDELPYKILDALEVVCADELLGPLVALRDRGPSSGYLDRAIETCDPARRQQRVRMLNDLLTALNNNGMTGALSQDRFNLVYGDQVQLHVGSDSNQCYDVDALLARAHGSIDGAAALVRDDLSRE